MFGGERGIVRDKNGTLCKSATYRILQPTT